MNYKFFRIPPLISKYQRENKICTMDNARHVFVRIESTVLNFRFPVKNAVLMLIFVCPRYRGKYWKVQVGNDQEMAKSERNSLSTNRGVGKK